MTMISRLLTDGQRSPVSEYQTNNAGVSSWHTGHEEFQAQNGSVTLVSYGKLMVNDELDFGFRAINGQKLVRYKTTTGM